MWSKVKKNKAYNYCCSLLLKNSGGKKGNFHDLYFAYIFTDFVTNLKISIEWQSIRYIEWYTTFFQMSDHIYSNIIGRGYQY